MARPIEITAGSIVVVGAAPLIYLIEPDEARLPVVAPLLGPRSTTEGVRLVLPTVVVAEVLVRPIEQENWDLVEELLAFVRRFTLVPLDLDVAQTTANVRATTILPMPDSVVVATAVYTGAALIVTNDRTLARRSFVPCAVVDDYL